MVSRTVDTTSTSTSFTTCFSPPYSESLFTVGIIEGDFLGFLYCFVAFTSHVLSTFSYRQPTHTLGVYFTIIYYSLTLSLSFYVDGTFKKILGNFNVQEHLLRRVRKRIS